MCWMSVLRPIQHSIVIVQFLNMNRVTTILFTLIYIEFENAKSSVVGHNTEISWHEKFRYGEFLQWYNFIFLMFPKMMIYHVKIGNKHILVYVINTLQIKSLRL